MSRGELNRWFLALLLLAACGTSPKGEAAQERESGLYFSLQRYFLNETERLNRLDPAVEKTLLSGERTEIRRLKPADWEKELAHFLDSDINKASFRGLYRQDSSAGKLHYHALDSSLRVRDVLVEKGEGNQVLGIRIRREVSNYLYHSRESLEYYPDSIYRIERFQQIRLLGGEKLTVSGRFLKP